MSASLWADQGAAIIGLGFIGGAHIEALRRLGIPTAGVLGSSPESTRQAAARLGLRAYATLEELLADPAVTVVHQCGPNAVHAPQNLLALAAGKHVLSEKPLGISAAECRAQLEAAEAGSRLHGVNFSYRGYAAVQQMRDLIASGEIGEVRYLHGHYLQDWLLFPTDFNWRVGANPAETRAVADIGSHLSDLARFVTGASPQRLLARFSTLHPERRRPTQAVQTFTQGSGQTEAFPVSTEDQASILVDYPGGVHANFEVSQVAAGHKNDLQLEVQGTLGAVRWRQEQPEELEIGTRSHRRTVQLKDASHPFSHYPPGHPEGLPDAITNVVRGFYQTLGGTPTPYPTFRDGLAAALLTEAAYRSSAQQTWVDVPEI
ncbi:Gfo/Idh/MocA family protein [Deinococcus ruber]|uniref:Dehydrogenase n=1 Tax=Deinococcus ruber TaxID=1848197 RepID=A0A918CNI3_9DEIO|nr:Gfo/Idh/MocA family oxidoreductase [Deinococcus ruber]GGR31981.1 dehydrogenase [Deinococcus ruber]